MNLLEERWIPVRRASGEIERIAPHEITDRIHADPIVALDACRPDFNGALIQFLIGLVQTAWVRADVYWDRDSLLWSPPQPTELQALFAPLKDAFDLDGEGPRFMQDLTLAPEDDPTENEISALLIDFPGAQSIERNTDHFVKRGSGGGLCPHCAATALFSLMTNAPGGGVGHRTSIRGGGPLTTLVVVCSQLDESLPRSTLWRDVACNVIDSSAFKGVRSGPQELLEVFPWLRPINDTMGIGGAVQPLNVHPLQVYWATPRRIRLIFPESHAAGDFSCALCGCAAKTHIGRYFTKNYGLNYKGPWRHPLSPYYRSKAAESFLPVHPQPDGMTYRHWLGWALGSTRSGRQVVPAAAVQAFQGSSVAPGQLRLRAFGYDMDNMKARCWYETTFPLFGVGDGSGSAEISEIVASIVEPFVASAELVARLIRDSVGNAWLEGGKASGDLGFVEAIFWDRTEGEFYAVVEEVIALATERERDAYDRSEPLRNRWLDVLQFAGRRIFDEIAARGQVEAGNPAKIAAAHRGLLRQLYGSKLRQALGLMPIDTSAPARKRRSSNSAPKKTMEAT